MIPIHRRRFLSALAVLGISTQVRGQSSSGSTPDYYYELKNRLLRGQTQDLEGEIETKGLPDNYTSEFTLDFLPEDGIYPEARIGRFATPEEMRDGRQFHFPRVRLKGFYRYLAAEGGGDPSKGWGNAEDRTFRINTLEIILPPYLWEESLPRPFQVSLEVGGEALLSQSSPGESKAFMRPEFVHFRALFREDLEERYLNAIVNRIEAAGAFEVVLTSGDGREVARLPFQSTNMDAGRGQLFSLVDSHLAEMESGEAPRKRVPASSGGGGAACPATAATVGLLGLADTCWELESFRTFRDQVLTRTEVGKGLIRFYYVKGESIVSGINRRSDADRVWAQTYWAGVLPLAVLIRLGFRKAALRYYRRVFTGLLRASEQAG